MTLDINSIIQLCLTLLIIREMVKLNSEKK